MVLFAEVDDQRQHSKLHIKCSLSTTDGNMALFSISHSVSEYTVNHHYNDSICSQNRCHSNEFAIVQNT